MLTYETSQRCTVDIDSCFPQQLHMVSSFVFIDYTTLILICIVLIISCV